MFMHCPHCQSLVATDPVTGTPPPRCPRCEQALDGPAAPTRNDAAGGQADAARTPRSEALVDAVAATPPLEAAPEDQPTAVEAVTDPRPVTDDDEASLPADAVPAEQTGAPDPSETVGDEATPSAASLIDDEEAPSPEAVATPGAVVDRDADADSAGLEGQEDEAERAGSAPIVADTGSTETTPSPSPRATKSAPRFAHVRAPAAASQGQHRWWLPALIAGLTILLALQWALADRERLAADARWRPFVIQLCGVLRCSVPPWREPSAFALLDRDVRPHPRVPGVLRVTASFRNNARWAQGWPDVVLTLSDLEGRAVGTRRFSADEYLGATPTQETLASGQTATIRLEVIEPSPRSVAFAFDFR